MSKITTQDCKEFLEDTLGKPTNTMKRLRKYKDTDGLYIREFLIDNTEIHLIKEMSDGSLILHNGELRSNLNTKKEFDSKKVLKSFLKILEEDNEDDYDEDDYVEPIVKIWNKIKKFTKEEQTKLAGEFTFFFPDNVYNNNKSKITNGLQTPMVRKGDYGTESFCFTFNDSLDSDPDLYLSDILKKIIPSYFDKVDEYNFEIDIYDKKTPKNVKEITIEDVINIMEDLGFKYKNNSEYGDEQCMLFKLGLK